MHELSIALSIINLAIKEAEKSNATRVSELELEIGEMAGVNIEALEFSMSIAMQNTILEGAKVRIVEIRSLAVFEIVRHVSLLCLCLIRVLVAILMR